MNLPDVAWSVSLARADGQESSLVGEENDVIGGLFEDTDYILTPSEPSACTLYIDDVQVTQLERSFIWRAGFFAGEVSAVFVERNGKERKIWLDVSPTPEKSGRAQFAEMVDAIRSFDNALLLGTSDATLTFGRNGRRGRLDDYLLLSRLFQYGELFLDAVRKVTSTPHQALTLTREELPLSRVRRLSTSAFQDRRLVALAMGLPIRHDYANALLVHAHVPALSVDTPANRALLALLGRFETTVRKMVLAVETMRLSGEAKDKEARQARRLEVLQRLQNHARELLCQWPFSAVTRAETSAAGLTQVSAQPTYAHAYRLGTAALSSEIAATHGPDALHIRPSWGIYETWCFVSVVEIVRQFVPDLSPTTSKVAPSQLAFAAHLNAGGMLEVLFQPKFSALDTRGERPAKSLSQERIPDIAIVHHGVSGYRFLLLDAKYRSGRSNVLEAMASGHIYHDSLRIAGRKPDLALLLLPGESAVVHLEDRRFWQAHHIGTLSRFGVGENGVGALGKVLDEWLRLLAPS